MTKKFEIQMNKEDYEICEKYGFFFEKNFEEIVKDVAKQLRKCENNKKYNSKGDN